MTWVESLDAPRCGLVISSVGGNEDWARRVYGAQPFVDKSPPAYHFFEQSFIDNYPDLRALASVTATPQTLETCPPRQHAPEAIPVSQAPSPTLGPANPLR